MPLTKDEFQEACLAICPHCRNEALLRYRAATKEYVHDITDKGALAHSICWANGLRNSRFAEGM